MSELLVSGGDREAEEDPCEVTRETFEGLTRLWHLHRTRLAWSCPFVLPPWLEAWWKVFGADVEPLILVVRRGDTVLGMAPFMVQGSSVRFLGDPDVCDYFDCVTAPGREPLFFKALFEGLRVGGFTQLELGPLRADSAVRKFLESDAFEQSVEWRRGPQDVVSELELPDSWDGFLNVLNGKQRHELRRKLRRLHEAGEVAFRTIQDAEQTPRAMKIFLRLFTMNRDDKAAFMTEDMARFFQELARGLAGQGLLSLLILEMAGRPAASVFCVDHGGTRYLYNNGYDGAWQKLSVGLMSKVLSLRDAIERGFERYNFLKGGEDYKFRLGGKADPLWHCHVTLR